MNIKGAIFAILKESENDFISFLSNFKKLFHIEFATRQFLSWSPKINLERFGGYLLELFQNLGKKIF